jgi:hypothetical protein
MSADGPSRHSRRCKSVVAALQKCGRYRINTGRVYFMKVEGNKLTMKSPGVIEPMTGVTSALVIELVKAD